MTFIDGLAGALDLGLKSDDSVGPIFDSISLSFSVLYPIFFLYFAGWSIFWKLLWVLKVLGEVPFELSHGFAVISY